MLNEIPLRLRWTCANSGNTTSSRSFDRLQQGSLRSKNIIYIRSDNPKELSGKKSELYHKVRLLSLSICQPELPLQVNKFVQILNTSCKFHHKSFNLHQHPYSHNLNIVIHTWQYSCHCCICCLLSLRRKYVVDPELGRIDNPTTGS